MASLRLFLFSGKNYFSALKIIYAGYGNGRCRPFMIKMPPVGGGKDEACTNLRFVPKNG